jgi:hypothetical protein
VEDMKREISISMLSDDRGSEIRNAADHRPKSRHALQLDGGRTAAYAAFP